MNIIYNELINIQKHINNNEYDVFLSHNWGNDEAGRNNHERVKYINNKLINVGNIYIYIIIILTLLYILIILLYFIY